MHAYADMVAVAQTYNSFSLALEHYIHQYFLSAADFIYFYSLSLTDSMISIVSMVRRGSVVVSFLFGALLFHEKNLKGKAVDLLLVLLGMVFLYIGSR